MIAREAFATGEHLGGLSDRIAEFSRFLIRQERSSATVRTYGWALKDLVAFLESCGVTTLERITRKDLEAWQDRLIAAGMAPRSRSLATTGVRQFLKWGADHDYCDSRLKDWLAAVRVRPLKPKPLPPADLASLIRHYGPAPPRGPLYLLEFRDRAMFFLFVATGARVSEGLQFPRHGYERVTVRQKGGTEKLLTLPPGVQPYIREYVSQRQDRAPQLFVTVAATPMSPAGVRQVWQRVSKRLAITPFTTHSLRHTFATELLAKGVDPVTVAELMGHHGMASIKGYMEVRPETRNQAERAIDEVLQIPTAGPPPDPRLLSPGLLTGPEKPKQRGRPRFRIVQ
jgi:site-specific recombinase XerD